MPAGYYRYPSIHDDKIVFTCEDDLWTVPAAGGVARRLTANLAEVNRPVFSPDGKWLAFTGKEEGPTEVFRMEAAGGPIERLTYLGAATITVGFHPEGRAIYFASNAGQPFRNHFRLFQVDLDGKDTRPLACGPAFAISHGPSGAAVIGRHGLEPARWKRYRGGLCGELWIDREGNGEFAPLMELEGNLSRPMWIDDRIYFLSDHEGISNLYSCDPAGENLSRHTDSEEFYLRNPDTDGRRIVYHGGGDLFLFDPQSGSNERIDVELHSPQVQRQRKFVPASRYMDDFALHPEGHSAAVCSRGKVFSMPLWEDAVTQYGARQGVRYRLPEWLPDGKRVVMISDEGGEEALEVHRVDAAEPPQRIDIADMGRPLTLAVSPKRDEVVLSNHRFELWWLNLESGEKRMLDRSLYERIAGVDWSPDGGWVAYSLYQTSHTAAIRLCEVATGNTHTITRPVLLDVRPNFDPDGKYLYFLSYRDFNPVYDHLHFDLGFPCGVRPYLVTLRKELPSPLIPTPRPPGEKLKEEGEGKDKEQKNGEETLQIDVEGIENRVQALPVPVARYEQVCGLKGKVLFTVFPVESRTSSNWYVRDFPSNGTLDVYDFDTQEKKTLISNVHSFRVSQDRKALLYRSGNRLRAVKAGEKPEEGRPGDYSRKSGWLDFRRLRLLVEPLPERQQMYREAWRLQRDHFWAENMSEVDWERVYQRYLPLVDRVVTRSEFSDLLWEMQGELGTSHAYEFGGDYRAEPRYDQGFLAADFAFDEGSGGYRITHIVRGDPWDVYRDSPLNRLGAEISEGDILLAVAGQPVSRERPPESLLLHLAGQEVQLTLAAENGSRSVTVKTLRDDRPARYREWVETNRARVHEQTEGQVGYIHIPDMGPRGFAEFHRSYLAEVDRDGLIVDARYNGGGHVSPLILEKLARRHLGYSVPRWSKPKPYPTDSISGPMVAITNQSAGSDGDIFSHCFQVMKLGPLVGKRTWGGVVGISVRHWLVDGTATTQPEFPFWFFDIGWNLENQGVEPDVPVEIRPQDYAAGEDPQLVKAIEIIQASLREHPPQLPDFGPRPNRALPKLPPRAE